MLFFYCSLLLSVLVFSPAKGQQPVADTLKDSTRERFQVAVFVPLYLDSAFDEMGEYRYDKTFPKFISPGLEFYEGVQLAADSLGKMGIPLDVYIYDTKSVANPVTSVIET